MNCISGFMETVQNFIRGKHPYNAVKQQWKLQKQEYRDAIIDLRPRLIMFSKNDERIQQLARASPVKSKASASSSHVIDLDDDNDEDDTPCPVPAPTDSPAKKRKLENGRPATPVTTPTKTTPRRPGHNRELLFLIDFE